MSLEINGEKHTGWFANLISGIVAICVLFWIGIAFMAIAAIFIAPLAFVFYLIMRIIT